MPLPRSKFRNGDDVARAQSKLLVDRIQERLTAVDTNARQVSLKAGLGNTAVSDILSGKNKNPSVPAVKAIADVLGCSLAYLTGETDKITNENEQRGAVPIPIDGHAEAGVFRQMPATSNNKNRPQEFIDGPPSRRYPGVRLFALEVRDDSMDAAQEGPITEGMYALCVDVADAQIEVESGRIYAIRHTRDQGQTYETSLRRAMVFRDRVELSSESHNPVYQKLIVPKGFETMAKAETTAIGLVYGAVTSFE